MQGSYAVTIRSTGYYAPTRKQLHRLAKDRRLTAVDSLHPAFSI